MKSYRPHLDPRRAKFADFVSRVHSAIDGAFSEWREQTGGTKADLARRLDVDKASLSRRLNGTSNLTLKTISDLAWALGRDIDFGLPAAQKARHNSVSASDDVIAHVWTEGETRSDPERVTPSKTANVLAERVSGE